MTTKFTSSPKNCRVFWLTAILAIASGGLTPAVSTATWSVGEPIVTYWGGPALTDSLAQLSANGGYNVVLVTMEPTNDTMDSQLALCQQYGLRAMMYSPLLTPASLDNGPQQAQLDAMIDRYKASSSAYTYMLTDEPNATEFAGLAQLSSYIHQRDSDHASYINLWSAMNSTKYALTGNANAPGASSMANTADYETYINQYMTTVQPEILSYDYYQLDYTSIPGLPLLDKPYYFYNLATARTKSIAQGIPFMNIVQACAWEPGMWRNPDQNELRFLAYTTLAYGAQGISYFNYVNWGQDYRDAVDRGGILQRATGLPTQTYYNLIPINNEFKNIAEQVQALKSIGAFHKGDLPPGTVRLPTDSPFTLDPDVANSTYASPIGSPSFMPPVKGIILSLFGDGTTVADASRCLVVNLDYDNAIFTVLVGTEELAVFDATTGHWTNLHSNRAELNIAAGGGVLVGFASVVPEPSTIVLLGAGLAALAAYFARRRRA